MVLTCYLFSAQVYMLRRRAFGNLYTKDFNWTIKNCVTRRGSSKGNQHMTVSAADNRTRFSFSGYAKFQWIFHENDIDLLYSNKQ